MLANKACPATTGLTTTSLIVSTTENNSTTNIDSSTDNVGPVTKRPKARPAPYSKPILLTNDRRHRKKKSISWQPDEKIQKVHYFEFIADERVNVTRVNDLNQPTVESAPTAASQSVVAGSSPNAHANRLNPLVGRSAQADVDPLSKRTNPNNRQDSNEGIKYMEWKLILIDFTPELPSPGWNSVERSAQAERETYVLGAIDLPGQPSTLDEPDGPSGNELSTKDDASSGVKIIPLDNPEGMYTEYPDMYNSEIVNGVRVADRGVLCAVPSNWLPAGWMYYSL